MKIASRWKLTFDPTGTPLVLLNLGEMIDAELEWKLSRAVEIVPLAAAAAPFIRPAGNNVYAVDFTVYRVNASDELGRRSLMDALGSTDDLGKKPLRVSLGNEAGAISDYYYQFANAIVRGLDTFRTMEGARVRTAYRYAITATKLSKVTP